MAKLIWGLILVAVISITTSMAFATEGGNHGGGGGNAFPELRQVNRESIVEVASEISVILPTIRGIEVLLKVRRQTSSPFPNSAFLKRKSPMWGVFSPEDLRTMFVAPDNIYELIHVFSQSGASGGLSDRWIVQDEPCFDPKDTHHGYPKDASAIGSGKTGSICLSVGRLAQDVQAGELRVKLLSLIAHELTHLILGGDEMAPNTVQGLVESSLKLVANFESIERLTFASTTAQLGQLRKLELAQSSWANHDFAESCRAVEDAYGALSDVTGALEVTADLMGISLVDARGFAADSDSRMMGVFLKDVCRAPQMKGPSKLDKDNLAFANLSKIPIEQFSAGSVPCEDLSPYLRPNEYKPFLFKTESTGDLAFAANLATAVRLLKMTINDDHRRIVRPLSL